jgi:hypothetical protein
MSRGPKGERRPRDVIGNKVFFEADVASIEEPPNRASDAVL